MKIIMGQPNDLLVDDLELLLHEIEEFNTATSNNKPLDIPQSLENYLQFVAKSGNTVFPWSNVRNLFRVKMVNAIQQFQEPSCPNEGFVLERFDVFRAAAPFTVQRLTELILQPTRHYRKKEKFLRGLEKTVLVVSTVEPHSVTDNQQKNGNDIHNTSAASCEGETETVAFNRTFSLGRHDLLSSSVRSSPMDVVDPQNIVIESVTSAANAANVISVNINTTSAEIITEDVTNSTVSPLDAETVDKVIAVSAEAIIVDTVSDTTAAVVISMESGESQDVLASAVQSTNVVLDPVTTSAVEDTDVGGNKSLAAASVVSESVTTSAMSVDAITPEKGIPNPTESIIIDTISDASDAVVVSMKSDEDRLSSSQVTDESSTENVIFDPVTTSAAGTAVDVNNQNIETEPGSTGSAENVTSSAATSVDTIGSDKKLAVPADDTTDSVISMESDAGSSMECESSTGLTEISASAASLLPCVSEQADMSTPMQQDACSISVTVTESVLENVSSSLINMENVKLPLEEGNNISMECQPQSSEQASNEFHSVTSDSESPNSTLDTPAATKDEMS